MAQSFTSYVVDNDRRFQAAIDRCYSVVRDLRIPFGQILADFYRSEQSIFALKSPGLYPDFKNGGVNSRYARFKEKKFGHKYPLLVASGALAASLTNRSAPGAIASIGPNSLTIGTTIPYGIYHQSDAPRKKIPLRKFLFIGPEAPRFATSEQMGRPTRWLNILNDFALTNLRRSGAFV